MSSRVAIEINDTAIIIHDGLKLIQNSPGYIIDVAKRAWLGKEARERAFLHSNECQNKFWYEIARAESNTIDQVDVKLAMRHLASVWQYAPPETSAVVLIVPGTFTKTGLGLLLGICKQLDIPVQAMVHQAVLCPYQHDHQGDTLHLDVQLHHSAITKLVKKDQQFAAGDTKVVSEGGLTSIYAQVAEFIAQEFIEKTRLDPMHSAELEQQLHNHLPKWLQVSQHNDSVTCQLQHRNNTFEVIIYAHKLHAVYEPLMNNLLQEIKLISASKEIIICLSEHVDVQFGFSRFAHKYNLMVRTLNTAYYAKQSFQYDEDVLSYDGQVYLNKQLPYTKLFDGLNTLAENVEFYEKPDHVLFCHRAYPIKQAISLVQSLQGEFELHHKYSKSQGLIFTILENPIDVCIEFDQQQAVIINNQQARPFAKLSVGDCIKIDACEDVLILIKVEI